MCDGGDKEIETVARSINYPVRIERSRLGKEFESFMNLRHLCISDPIGIVVSPSLRDVKIVRMYARGCSLSQILSNLPEWRNLHGFELLHGHLTAHIAFLSVSGVIQITDCCARSFVEVQWNAMECNGMDVQPRILEAFREAAGP
jgi:hypothetical protein